MIRKALAEGLPQVLLSLFPCLFQRDAGKPQERSGIFMKKRERTPQIRLSDAQKEKLNDQIKAFYLDVRGEEIGMIEQMQLLELFEQHLAPIVYNRALDDAKRWFAQTMDNVESDFYALYKNEA